MTLKIISTSIDFNSKDTSKYILNKYYNSLKDKNEFMKEIEIFE
jgi:hypothetical protein